MRAVERALAACAVTALMACSPETETASHVGSMQKVTAGSVSRAGAGGMARAGAGGQVTPAVVAESSGQAGMVALAVAAPASTPAVPSPAPTGPTTAIARVEQFMRKSLSAAAGMVASKPAANGSAGVGGTRPASASMEQPSAEICERLQKAGFMRPLPSNDRVLALLAACAVLQQPSAAGAAAPSGAGSGGANAGDLPAGGDERDPLTATAVFTQAPDGVALLLVLDGCKDGALYPVHIHAGHSCADESGIGERWDRTRGDDIPDLHCNGSHASQEYVRSHNADKPWTLGGPSVSDVVGHALVIGDPDDRSVPIACGVTVAP